MSGKLKDSGTFVFLAAGFVVDIGCIAPGKVRHGTAPAIAFSRRRPPTTL